VVIVTARVAGANQAVEVLSVATEVGLVEAKAVEVLGEVDLAGLVQARAVEVDRR